MMSRHIIVTLTLLAIFSGPTNAESDTRTVEAEFGRCESVMERVKREHLRFEEIVAGLKRKIGKLKSAVDMETEQKFLKLESRVDYLQGRIDRASSQRDKIRGDLKKIKGPTCPSCIASSINMYCRNGETLTREIEDSFAGALALEDRIGTESRRREQNDDPDSSAIYAPERASIVKIMETRKPIFDACTSEAVGALLKQYELNLLRADSLQAAGATRESLQSLRLAGLLLKQVSDKCGAK